MSLELLGTVLAVLPEVLVGRPELECVGTRQSKDEKRRKSGVSLCSLAVCLSLCPLACLTWFGLVVKRKKGDFNEAAAPFRAPVVQWLVLPI